MIASLKSWLASTAILTGATARAARRQGHQLRIVMYHGVLPRVEGPSAFGNLFISADRFARHMRYLQKNFCVISCSEALAANGRFPERAVMVTFDDGYRHTITTALPILRSLGLPSAVFIVPGLIDRQEGLWFDALRLVVASRRVRDPQRRYRDELFRLRGLSSEAFAMARDQVLAGCRQHPWVQEHSEFALASWDEWRQAVAEGSVTIGAHGLTHTDLTTLSPAALRQELSDAKRRIEEELGVSCQTIAYPYGAWNASVAAAAREAGYACAVTTEDGLNTAQTDPLRWHRTMIGDQGKVSLFRARVSGAWQALRSAGA
ncbi:MAG: polysaccharide deacetylase family protein [Candidatus Omnitrophica bacterium]|nr:polysaccharide deacetylase family protein [Candidatus Omnitrophota bacterium]